MDEHLQFPSAATQGQSPAGEQFGQPPSAELLAALPNQEVAADPEHLVANATSFVEGLRQDTQAKNPTLSVGKQEAIVDGGVANLVETADGVHELPADVVGILAAASAPGTTEDMQTVEALAHEAPPSLAQAVELTLAGGASAEAIEEVVRDIDAAQHNITSPSGTVSSTPSPQKSEEYVAPKQTLAERLATDNERVQKRAEKAIDASEFIRTPELEKAIKGYYSDHHRLATVVEDIVSKELSKDDQKQILAGEFDSGHFEVDTAIKNLCSIDQQSPSGRIDALQTADKIVSRILLNETCVGALTLEEDDIAVIPKLHGEIRTQAEREGLILTAQDGRQQWSTASSMSGHKIDLVGSYAGELEREIDSRKESNKQLARKEMRHAGQLIFHNTPYLADVARHDVGEGAFKLATRGFQYESTGNYVHGSNADIGEQHSNLIHWCESYMPSDYKAANNTRQNTSEQKPGTIAVPMGELVRQAPYSARDIQYGVLEAKPGQSPDGVPTNTSIRLETNYGSADLAGDTNGYDRVFLADNNAAQQGDAQNVEIDFGRGMTPEGITTSYILLTRDDVEKHYSGLMTPFGAGEGYPQTVVLECDSIPRSEFYALPEQEQQSRAELQQQYLRQTIAELQESSMHRPEYTNRYVVPLRGGVMEFQVEGMRPSKNLLTPKARNTANLFG